MRTAQEWLALPESEQAMKLARVLIKKPWEHEWDNLYDDGVWCGNTPCKKCEATILSAPCPVPDPIDIHDWNVAKAMQAKYCGDLFRRMGCKVYAAVVVPVFHTLSPWGLDYWLAGLCKPEDARLVLIICAMVAAAMAKES